MKQQLTGCKPVQLTELEAEFANLKGGKKAKPERLLKSQQQFAVPDDDVDGATDGAAKAGDGADEDDVDEDMDPYESFDPVDILEKLPKNFYELVMFNLYLVTNCLNLYLIVVCSNLLTLFIQMLLHTYQSLFQN